MDKNELNVWIEERLAALDKNVPKPDARSAFARLQSRIRSSAMPFGRDKHFDRLGGRNLSSDAAAATRRTSERNQKIDQNGRAGLQSRRKCSVTNGALAPEAMVLSPFRNLLPGGVGRKFWPFGALAAAAACLCLLTFPTSRDAVQHLFAKSSDSKIVYVGQVYADLKTMKDKQPEVDFTIKDMEGRNITLSTLKGKVVLLNFWATWCGGCRTEIPWLVEFDRKYRNKGLVVIGISEDHIGASDAAARKPVEAYVKTAGVNYEVAVDDGSVANRYELFNMPATYLIGRDGKVSAASVGIIDKAECEAEILRLLGN